jgi:hypothetical protein
MEAKGRGGTIAFDGTFLTIERVAGVARSTRGGKAEMRIPVTQVTAVHFKPAGPLANGFVQFSLSVGVEHRTRAIMFNRSQQPAFEKLRAEIERAVGGTDGVHAAPQPQLQPGGAELVDQLSQLADLHGQGSLTDAEFQAAKSQLLGTTPPA